MTVSIPTVERLQAPEGSGINFGAVISGIDIENMTGKSHSRAPLEEVEVRL
jgi:hypothetical protein